MPEFHDLGHGCSLTGYTSREEGMKAAIAAGSIICMPAVENVEPPDDVPCKVINCPMCGKECYRMDYIPAEAKVACTSCALRAASRSAT